MEAEKETNEKILNEGEGGGEQEEVLNEEGGGEQEEVLNEEGGGEQEEEEEDSLCYESARKKAKKSNQDKKMMQVIKPKPNFFLGFQIYNTVIHQKVKKLQEEIIAKNPKLLPALINISTLHVTLAVTRLVNEKDIKTIRENLDEWATKNVSDYFGEPLTLSFTGIKTFSNVVAYVDIEPCTNKEKLVSLSKSLNNMLSSAGFFTDPKSFTPHLTILKLSKDFKQLKGKKRFQDDFETLKNYKEHFGKQEIRTIQLLSMDDPRDDDGYYKCLHEICVSQPKIEVDCSD